MTASYTLKNIDDQTRITIKGHLDAKGGALLWTQIEQIKPHEIKPHVIFNLDTVEYLDTAGALLLNKLEPFFIKVKRARRFDFEPLPPEHARLLAFVRTNAMNDTDGVPQPVRLSMIEQTGRHFSVLIADIKELITFTGEITWALVKSIRHPGKIRWADTMAVAERSGVDALPIVALISFIVGLVMAFQAAIPMRMFGAELYVANLIGISMVRELGPLMTAIVLAGRSSSAFAAEIGTMRINEEIDALSVMGLDPVRFLIIPRLIAATLITPLLTIFANLMGMLGGALVITSLGYPIISYTNQIVSFVTWGDFTGGLIKCFVFGILIAATGCIRGYQTQSGPSAVGDSTTRAVVTGIVLIAVFDGIFSVIYYYLGV